VRRLLKNAWRAIKLAAALNLNEICSQTQTHKSTLIICSPKPHKPEYEELYLADVSEAHGKFEHEGSSYCSRDKSRQTEDLEHHDEPLRTSVHTPPLLRLPVPVSSPLPLSYTTTILGLLELFAPELSEDDKDDLLINEHVSMPEPAFKSEYDRHLKESVCEHLIAQRATAPQLIATLLMARDSGAFDQTRDLQDLLDYQHRILHQAKYDLSTIIVAATPKESPKTIVTLSKGKGVLIEERGGRVRGGGEVGEKLLWRSIQPARI